MSERGTRLFTSNEQPKKQNDDNDDDVSFLGRKISSPY